MYFEIFVCKNFNRDQLKKKKRNLLRIFFPVTITHVKSSIYALWFGRNKKDNLSPKLTIIQTVQPLVSGFTNTNPIKPFLQIHSWILSKKLTITATTLISP